VEGQAGEVLVTVVAKSDWLGSEVVSPVPSCKNRPQGCFRPATGFAGVD
jgi:hypothetical protein